MRRRLSIIAILLTAAFFAGGWWPVRKGWIKQETYLAVSGVVGGIASLIGLLGLVRSPLTRRDFETVEWESVAKIAQSSKELDEIENRKARAHSELEQLTKTRAELADLVKKASTALFLREELDRSSQKLSQFLGEHSDLRKELEDYRENRRRLIALNEELNVHPDGELIAEVMSRVRSRAAVRKTELVNAVASIPIFGPFLKAFLLILDVYERAFRIAIGRRRA